MSLEDNLKRVVSRYAELRSVVAEHPDPGSTEYTKLLKEFSELGPVVEGIESFQNAQQELADLDELRKDPDSDAEMRELAEAEYYELRDRLPNLERQVMLSLLPKDEADSRNAILEVRAGTGGDEAALFAAELFRMYQRYAEAHRWRFEVLDYADTGIGGVKEASAGISGTDVFSRLKFESGVHRVQRIPVTESGGRIHTSAATVAVLPEAEEVDIEIENKDLRIDTYRAQGAGGQHVNTTDSAVRITHLPTGVVVQCQDEKSQHKNKAKAMKVLRARLYDHLRQEQADSLAADRKQQVGSGDRSERIRTYNFPQGRMTDHRINLTLYKLDKIMTGEALDEVIDAIVSEDQAKRLATFE
ncbi:peptide chain release factor 1 [Rhodovibrionaceae bacterium A322]